MLAIAMKSEYQYNINIMKVIYMLAIHELGETIIGDLIPFEITNKEKLSKMFNEIFDNQIIKYLKLTDMYRKYNCQ